uniref:Uncharacterized protein n=1 Tax=Arundo donax TaxID=35708 RepID=A0A0A9G1L7_ARUDO
MELSPNRTILYYNHKGMRCPIHKCEKYTYSPHEMFMI